VLFAFRIHGSKESQQGESADITIERYIVVIVVVDRAEGGGTSRVELELELGSSCFQNTFIAKSVVVVAVVVMAWKIHGFNCAKLCCLFSLHLAAGCRALPGFFT